MRTIQCRRDLQTTRGQVRPAALRRHSQLLPAACPCPCPGPGHLATGLAAIGLAAALATYGNGGGGVTSNMMETAVHLVPAANVVPATTPTASSRPTTALVVSRPGGVLRPGDRGPGVLDLQQRLAAAGYWLGSADGSYGMLTQQAVLALQKAAGIGTDGLAGPATTAALQRGVRPQASSTRGQVLEVDLARQVLLVVRDGTVEQVFNTSTGTGQWYEVEGRQQLAVTPTGSYRVFREVDGVDRAPLGELYRPKYFNGGIAVHGYPSVPARPASHGCVRVTNAAMDWLWSSGTLPVGRAVLVR